MSVFAPEMSLAEVIGRVRRTLKSVAGATYAHVLLHDAPSGEFVLLSADAGAASAGSAASAAAIAALGGSVGPNCLSRIPAARCGALYQALATEDVVSVADVTADARFLESGSDWPTAHDLLDAALRMAAETSSLLAAPVVVGSSGAVAAVILVTNKRPPWPSEAPSAAAAAAPRGGGHSRGYSADSAAATPSVSSDATPSGAATATPGQHGGDTADPDAGFDDTGLGFASDADWLEDDAAVAAAAGGTAAVLHGGAGGGAVESWSSARRATQHLTTMRRWTMARRASASVTARPSTRHSSGVVLGSGGGMASARQSFSATAAPGFGARRGSGSGIGGLGGGGGPVVLGREPPTVRRPKPPVRAARPAAPSFSERDATVVAGIAAELALALEDRSLEFETLVGAREYTLLAAVRDPVRVFVDAVSGIELAGGRRRRSSSSASARATLTLSPGAGGSAGSSTGGGSPLTSRSRLSSTGVVCAMLLVHGSEVLSTSTSAVGALVSLCLERLHTLAPRTLPSPSPHRRWPRSLGTATWAAPAGAAPS